MSTHAELMVTKLESLLLANAGVTTVNVDGQQVAYADLEVKWRFWKGRVARERGKASTISTIRLDGF